MRNMSDKLCINYENIIMFNKLYINNILSNIE